ncbi:MAG: prolipoprotein diacylglyceryl transferase [FCB group bacterium]|nr:prolipoprotein diacylglyceryl transferase [FCB group bacterium]
MYPVLFHIGPIPIRSYGVMLALAFIFGMLYVRHQAKVYNKPLRPFLFITYLLILGGVVGARLFYVLFHLSEFSHHWFNTINPFAYGGYGIAGLNLYGGIVTAVIVAYFYCRLTKISVLETFDIFAPAFGLGLGIARIGCFLNGCCFGTPTNLPWGVSFPVGSIPYYVFQNIHLHPSQLYSSLYGLFLFFLLNYLMKRKKFNGQLVALLFMIEAVFRFAIEYVRYYESAMYFSLGRIHPTYNQVFSISLFLLGLAIYIHQKRRSKSVNKLL